MSDPENRLARNLRVAFDLHTAGVLMHRQTLRRRFPEATDQEIERRLQEWLLTRPGAELGDAEGVPGTWPRRGRRNSGEGGEG